jgi:citrate synthase
VAYLLLHGELPTQAQLDEWTHWVTMHTMVHENIKKFVDGFHHDAHPMGMLVSAMAALSTFYPESKSVLDPGVRKQQIYRLVAKIPTVSAYAYRLASLYVTRTTISLHRPSGRCSGCGVK